MSAQTESDGPSTSGAHRWLAPVSLVIVALAAVMGWAASFVGLHDYGHTDMVGFTVLTAWLLPSTFDGAAFACSLMTYRASIHGRSALRGRILMWAFTGVSAWINWIHQPTVETRLVAAGLPVAAVAVFDVVLSELRADYETRHGRTNFRLRPGLLLLRWLVDRAGTSAAFRDRITSIPVHQLAGLAQTPTQPEPPADTAAPSPVPDSDTPEPSEAASEDSEAASEDSAEPETDEPAGEAPGPALQETASEPAPLGPVRPSSVRLPESVLNTLTTARDEAYSSGRSLSATDIQRLTKLPERTSAQLAEELAMPDTNGHAMS
ncbi:hypothetical protein FHR84_002611 [Actinopolyspora biskrensis]|uniref:DUF2637 domain-containing protein n=1 Tax=Actinopolyspora biskrensis TaxID=1470178 RepID=A0A852Z9Q6_9ACTN|nr:DUF2637 domain-containing protein [Actinopolyspora biskrensis]NYH79277.1 hypothetical protein [Actinopolyspora biskrensis]